MFLTYPKNRPKDSTFKLIAFKRTAWQLRREAPDFEDLTEGPENMGLKGYIYGFEVSRVLVAIEATAP